MTESDNVHRATGLGVYDVWFLTFTDPASRRGYWIRSTYHAPRQGPASAQYEDPDGSARYCHNSEIASCRLKLSERGSGDLVADLGSKGTTHAEWAGRTPAGAVEREFANVPA